MGDRPGLADGPILNLVGQRLDVVSMDCLAGEQTAAR